MVLLMAFHVSTVSELSNKQLTIASYLLQHLLMFPHVMFELSAKNKYLVLVKHNFEIVSNHWHKFTSLIVF